MTRDTETRPNFIKWYKEVFGFSNQVVTALYDNQLVLRAAVLREPATLDGIVSRERPVCHLASLAILGRTALFGGSFIGTSPMRTLLGHAQLSRISC
jgi:hypothetical protein